MQELPDPYIDAHRPDPGFRPPAPFYVLSRPTPISVRDQILRGTNLVQRLLQTGEISADRKLLVVGAGAGGASAAIEAARLGVRTCLVDQASAPFQPQARAISRTIDPTQYDWPVDHFAYGRMPWSGLPDLPLTVQAGPAPAMALLWQMQLLRAERSLAPRLVLRMGTWVDRTVIFNEAAGPGKRATTLSSGEQFVSGAIIDATGFGGENCRIVVGDDLAYEGQQFWSSDSFTDLNSAHHEVLISGSGDGALQDYLRVVTRMHHVIEIAERCRLPLRLLHAVQSAEDRAHRGLAWACEDPRLRPRHELPFMEERERAFSDAVAAALLMPDVVQGLARMFPVRPVNATVVYRGSNLGCYYGLNRFLTLLLSSYLDHRFSRRTLYPNCTVTSIEPSPHSAHQCIAGVAGNAHANGTYIDGVLVEHACFGKDHDVSFSGDAPGQATYNVIIVRHGLAPPKHEVSRPRHLAPYHRP